MLTSIVATGKVVSSIFLATDKLFRVEELAVIPSPHFINDSGLKINKDSTRDMLPSTSFTEKGVEGIITSTNSLVIQHLAIRLHKYQPYQKLEQELLNTRKTMFSQQIFSRFYTKTTNNFMVYIESSCIYINTQPNIPNTYFHSITVNYHEELQTAKIIVKLRQGKNTKYRNQYIHMTDKHKIQTLNNHNTNKCIYIYKKESTEFSETSKKRQSCISISSVTNLTKCKLPISIFTKVKKFIEQYISSKYLLLLFSI